MNKISIILGIVGAIVVIVCAVLGFRVLPDIVKKRTEDVSACIFMPQFFKFKFLNHFNRKSDLFLCLIHGTLGQTLVDQYT
jgi:hypothetical protein